MSSRASPHRLLPAASGLTARRLTQQAGVSRATLYDLSETKDECFFAAASEALEHLTALMAAAAASGQPPRERLERVVDTFVGFCGAGASAARLCLVELGDAGERGMAIRTAALDEMAGVVRGALDEALPVTSPLAPELLVGGLCSVAGSRLRVGRGAQLTEFSGDVLDGCSGRRRRRADVAMAEWGATGRSRTTSTPPRSSS